MRRFALRCRRRRDAAVFFRRRPVPFRFLVALRPWQRAALGLALAPFVLAGGASGAYYLRLHRLSAALTLSGLPLAPETFPGQAAARRVLVLSPHCDDETLGLGGTIADLRRAGVPVTVAFLTNGDGFPLAAGRALGEVRVSPDDYVRFAQARQTESLQALAALGVPARNVAFLSYPDRGLAALWQEHWDASRPFTSPYTGRAFSPYPRTFRPGAPYCGASLLSDISRVMARVRPTDVYVTHPSDDHPDHSLAAAFAQAALLEARDRNEPWARHARLRYYLVHRGDWPLPQGLHPEQPLLPPAGLRALDTRWEVLPVSPPARAAKLAALKQYRSQMAVMARFLRSFVRENELQGSLPERHAPPLPRRQAGGAKTAAAAAAAAVSPDALRDDVVRFAGPSADLSALGVWRDNDVLVIRLTTRGPISPRVRYTLRVRGEHTNNQSAARFAQTGYQEITLKRAAARAEGARVAGANTLEARVPLRSLNAAGDQAPPVPPQRVWVAAQTRWAGVPVDSTGFRVYALSSRRNNGGNGGNGAAGVAPAATGTKKQG